MDREGGILLRLAKPAKRHELKERIHAVGADLLHVGIEVRSPNSSGSNAVHLDVRARQRQSATVFVSNTTAALLALYPGECPLITEVPPVEAI